MAALHPIPFVPPLDDFEYGVVEQVTPLIRRLIADNPTKYSYRGTGTYIVGHGDVVVIDPGPTLDAHRDALAAELLGERVRAILVTHCHADHSPLAAWLSAETGAPTVAFGPHGAVDLDDADSDVKVEESIDLAFVPDVVAADGDVVAEIGGAAMRAVHTPGHTSNHLCFSLESERALFTGDHVMGWSTTVVSPPDGDMRAYVDSLAKVAGRHDATLWPTHGNPVTDVAPFLDAYLAHRLERERQVLTGVRAGSTTIEAMVAVMYADVREELHKAAGRSVFAHLVKLVDDGVVSTDGKPPNLKSVFHAV
ncbi:MAG: hypothetical protein JWN62_4679 [Acidimicrobiales bacterium]|nr:hypothetical protein [Acidimicrobiales bacterium]